MGFVLAIVTGMVAISQINSLQDLSKPITTGALNQLIGSTTFIMLLVVVVIAVGGVIAALKLIGGR